MNRAACAVLTALLPLALGASAQVTPTFGPRRTAAIPFRSTALPSTIAPAPLPSAGAAPAGALVVVGTLAGWAAMIGGAYVGASLDRRAEPCACELEGIVGGVLGALLLPPIVVPIVVHGVDGGVGSLGADFASAFLGGTAAALASVITHDALVLFVGAPLGEAIGATIAETR
jgi:hypothetical protein